MASGYILSASDLQYQTQRITNYWKALLGATSMYLQRIIDVGNTAIILAYYSGGSAYYTQDLLDLSAATNAMANIINYAQHAGVVTATDNTGGAGISSPTAPSVTPQGVPGSTTYYYQVIAHTLNGTTAGYTGSPPGSGVGSTTTGNATLSAATGTTGANYNLVTGYAVTGATSYDILWWNGSAWRLKANTTQTYYQDMGAADSAYVVPTSNTTAGTTQTMSVPNGSYGLVTSDAAIVAYLKAAGTDQTPLIRKPSDLTAGSL